MPHSFEKYIYEEHDVDITDEVGQSEFDYQNNKNNMENGIGQLSWVNVKSAVIYGLILGVVAVGLYMIQVGTVFALDWRMMVDAFIYGFLGSLLKNLLTTNSGNFMGMVKVIPETK